MTRRCFCTAWSESLGARPAWRVERLDVRGPTSSTVGGWILPAVRLYASGPADLKPLSSLSHLFAAARSFRLLLLLLLLLPTGRAAGQLGDNTRRTRRRAWRALGGLGGRLNYSRLWCAALHMAWGVAHTTALFCNQLLDKILLAETVRPSNLGRPLLKNEGSTTNQPP